MIFETRSQKLRRPALLLGGKGSPSWRQKEGWRTRTIQSSRLRRELTAQSWAAGCLEASCPRLRLGPGGSGPREGPEGSDRQEGPIPHQRHLC